MKKILLYEGKRILLPLLIFTVLGAALFVIVALNSNFVTGFGYGPTGEPIGREPTNTLVALPGCILGVLCFIVPALQFSYRMNRRSADLWYSLPVRREALTLVRALGGLVLVLVPYTVTFWAGFAAIAASENLFELGQYGVLYAASLPVGIGLFGINAFLYTRANSILDGIIFMLAWTFVLTLPFFWLQACGSNRMFEMGAFNWTGPNSYSTISPLGWLLDRFDALICGNSYTMPEEPLIYALGGVLAVGAWAGLFATARLHRAEYIGTPSGDWFGYRTLIPACMTFAVAIGIADMYEFDAVSMLLTYTFTLILGLAAYFVYRRSFRIKLADILCIAAALLVGTGLGFLGSQVLEPFFESFRIPTTIA